MTATTATDPVTRFTAGRRFSMTIGGKPDSGEDGSVRAVHNPSTGGMVAEVPEASDRDVDRAVVAARLAQREWAALPLTRRVAHLERLSRVLASRSEEFTYLEAIDVGNPLRSAQRDVQIALAHFRDWPSLAVTLAGRAVESEPGVRSFVSYHPYGVVGRITAFNHPLLFAINASIMALLAANTIVLKSSEHTPLSTCLLGELFAETLPPGVANVVSGGPEVGAAIARHSAVKRVSFVGSLKTGLTIQEHAAKSGAAKHVSLELGGKNAMVVFPDADIDAVVEGALLGMSLEISQGQSCQATSRILVHRRLYDAFVDRIAGRLRQYTVGPAYDPSVDLGPLVSERQLRLIERYVELGVKEGATLVEGGHRPGGVPPGGWYINPALFADVRPNMRIATEEVFGPLITVLPWDRFDQMLEIANGVDFGLSASVWSEDINLALETARVIEAGYVWVNDTNRHYAAAPYGGVKNSGVGREESIEELLSYLEVKSTHVRTQNPGAALARVLSRERTNAPRV